MSEDLKVIRLQNELETLDREWSIVRDGYMVSDKNGNRSEPSSGTAMFGGGIGVVMGIVWMVFTSSSNAPGGVALIGLVIIAASIVGMITGANKAQAYASARSVMEQRRAAVSKKLESAKAG